MSIASDLTAVATNLNSALDEINDKIEAKGGTASETVYGVAAAVENLPSGGAQQLPSATLNTSCYIHPTVVAQYYDFSDFSEFTQVEYIESTGTQFIQTDTVIYSTDKVEAEVAFVDRSLTTFAWCAREAMNSKFFNALNLTGEFRFDYFDEQFTGLSVINNQKYKITMDGNKFYLDDALIKTFTQVNSNSVNPACLMASYNPYKTYSNIGKMKHFGFRVWDNSSIIKANLVPCYHTATGWIGMFDTVNNKFYMNAGTGTFLKGEDVYGN